MTHKTFFISAFLLCVLNTAVLADDYVTGSGRRLGRGISNTAFGWTEILKSQEKVGDDHGILAGVLWGTLDGLGNGVKRTAAGLYETATFPIQTTRNNDPIVGPEFPLQNDRAGERPKNYTF